MQRYAWKPRRRKPTKRTAHRLPGQSRSRGARAIASPSTRVKAHTRARAKAVGRELGDAELDGLVRSAVLVLVDSSGRAGLRQLPLITADTGRLARCGAHRPAKDAGSYTALASSRAVRDSSSSFNCGAASSSPSWSRLVALTIGAVIDLRWSSQASATVALLALCFLATASSASRTPKPLSFTYFLTVWLAPRTLLPKSPSDRYLPVRKPAARDSRE